MKCEPMVVQPASRSQTKRNTACRLSMEQWASFVESHPASTVFHHPRWLELLVDQYGFGLQIWGLYEGGKVTAALPLLESRRLGRGRKLSAVPFSDVVPFLYRRREDGERLLTQLKEILPYGAGTVVLRCDEPLSPTKSSAMFVRHLIDLSPPIEEVEGRFKGNLRRNLRQAAKGDLRFDTGVDTGFIEDFYRLHLLTRRKHGVPVQPKSFFLRLQEQVLEPGLGFVGRVCLGNQPIATAVFLQHQDKFIYKYGASDPEFLSYRPNDLLMFHAIRIARAQGCTSFDFGISEYRQEGLRRFKSKWGAVESDVYDCYLRGEPRSATTDSLLFRLVSQVLRVAPTWCCRAAGEFGYRYVA